MEEKEILNEFIDLLSATHKKVANIFINMTRFDAMPRCVWDFNSNFIYVNEDFAESFGYTPEEMKDQPFSKFIYSDDIDKSMEEYRRNLDDENITVIQNFTNRFVHKDGSILNVLWVKGFNDFENKLGSGQIRIISSSI